MQSLVIIFIVVLGAILAMALVLFAATRRSQWNEDEAPEDIYPQRFFLRPGLSIGIALGILGGLAMGSVPGGAALGIGLGLILGQFLEKRRKGDVRPLTEQEKQERVSRTSLGIVVVFMFVLATVITTVLSLFK